MSKKRQSGLAGMSAREIKFAFYRGDTFFRIDPNDKKLAAKIEKFKIQCRKRRFIENEDKSYGVHFRPEWDEDYGFTYIIWSHMPYVFQERHYHDFDDLIEGEKKQIKFIKKARHNLAVLIRLKEKMKIPGPIQELKELYDENNISRRTYVPLTQEEIDKILKY